jgi:hypothetical protein
MAWGWVQKRWGAPLAAALWLASPAPLHARADEARREPERELNTVLFGSLDVGRTGYGNVGFKRTLQGPLDASGAAALVIVGYGGSPERTDPASDHTGFRHKAGASALLGYQWLGPSVALAGFIGPEIDYERDPDIGGKRAWRRAGLRGHAELWAHPTASTLVTATFIAGSARGHVWSRISAGYAVWGKIFVGPEISHYRTNDYREWRVGAHLTGVTLGRFTLRFSGGLASFDERTGGYVGLTGYIRM